MKYNNIVEAKFISRPNRFVAVTELDGKEVHVHVKNTGRCKELLVTGSTVYLEDRYDAPNRKYKYDLIAVRKGDLLINMDSQAPNKAAEEAILNGTVCLPGMGRVITLQRETVFGDSRFDIFVKDENGREGFVEVKGVTLENDGVVSFPDAPTERGIKHLNGLVAAKSAGYYAYVLFVIQMSGVKCFKPNDERHKAFGDALRNADEKGVHALAYECDIKPDEMKITTPVKVDLCR